MVNYPFRPPKTLLNFFSSTFFSSTRSLLPHLLTFLHTKPHTLHHILVKDFKNFKTRSLARIALLLLLSPAELLSKKSSWFAKSRPWTSSSIAFFLLESKLSGQVHYIVVCVSFNVFWDFCVLCIRDCLLSFESFVSRFLDPDRSLNRKRERFKVFEVEPRSNRSQTVMTS